VFSKIIETSLNFKEMTDVIEVKLLSHHWDKLLSGILDAAASDSVMYGRIKTLQTALLAVVRILHNLPSNVHDKLSFFGNEYPVILRSIINHLHDNSQKDTVLVCGYLL